MKRSLFRLVRQFKRQWIERKTKDMKKILYSLSILFLTACSGDSIDQYSKHYENRTEVQRILGVGIPNFKIIDSQLKHFREFDFEFEVQTTIEFEIHPDDNFFNTLDSICTLPVPHEPDKSSSFFYFSLENISRCWSKEGNNYQYERNTDFGEKFLHSTDAYFNFKIAKGSKTAEIEYGNY